MGFVAKAPRGTLLIGVVHLLPLPGAPQPSPGLDAVEARALQDARALIAGGCDGLILENFGDAPFAGATVDPWTIAAMTRLASSIRAIDPAPMLGINVLRNDAVAALSIAAATGASFIRVNVLVGAMVTDQGVITGAARALLLERNRLGASVSIVADVHVKHAEPLGGTPLEHAAHDAWTRGGADALIVTGSATGKLFDPSDLERVRGAAPGAPIWSGSGLTPENARAHGARLDGAIVGTWLHRDGDLSLPIDADRVRVMRDALGRT